MKKKDYPNNYLNPNFVDEGLVMHLNAAKATGTYGVTTGFNLQTIVWKDASGNNVDGALKHFGTPKIAWSTDSLTFNGGGSDFVEIASDGRDKFANQEFTIEVWAIVELGGNKPLFSYDTASPGISCAHLRIADTKCFFSFNIDGVHKAISGLLPKNFDGNKFNQFICTFKRGEQRLYVNGKELYVDKEENTKAAGSSDGQIKYYPTPVHIGKSSALGANVMFKGKISHVLYYDRVLSEREITQNKIAGAGDITTMIKKLTKEEEAKDVFSFPGKYINVKEAPYNAEGNGINDDTAAIQRALDAAASYYLKEGKKEPKAAEGSGNIYIPEGVYMIDADKALQMKSNTRLYMHRKAVLQAIPNDLLFYTILGIRRVENVEVYGGNIRGDRNEHFGTQGQWGMGISIVQASNIRIEGTRADECWADGVYIGSDTFYKATQDDEVKYPVPDTIKLIDVKADHNRRQGISLISGRHVDFIRPVLTNTRGFGDPEAGLDIEPDNNRHAIEDIYIEDAVTKNNGGAGILLYLSHLEKSQNAEGNFAGNDHVTIVINGHVDVGSHYGVLVQDNKCKLNPGGKVTINNAKWENARLHSLRINDHLANSYHIEVNNPSFLNAKGPSHLAIVGPHAILEQGDILGNVTITAPEFDDTTNRPNLKAIVVPYQLANEIIMDKKNFSINKPLYKGGYSGYTVPIWYKYAMKE